MKTIEFKNNSGVTKAITAVEETVLDALGFVNPTKIGFNLLLFRANEYLAGVRWSDYEITAPKVRTLLATATLARAKGASNVKVSNAVTLS